jgi:putative thioredoxin
MMSEMGERTGAGVPAGGSVAAAAPALQVQEIDQHNVQEVLQQSMQQPLVLVCWSAKLPDSVSTFSSIKQLISRFAGRIGMASLDCDDHPMLAQQLGAMQLPVAKVVAQGQVLAEFTGQEPEDQLIGLFTQLAGGPPAEAAADEALTAGQGEMDQFLQAVEEKRQASDLDAAQKALEAALADMADDAAELQAVRLKLGQILVEGDQFDAAEALIEQFKENAPEAAKLGAMIYFGREKKQITEDAATLKTTLAQVPEDHAVRFSLATLAVFDGEFSLARDELMHLMIKARSYGEGKPQKALLALLDLMGPDHPDAKGLRRKLFSLLH